jgi:hypothetical protein
VGRWEEGRSGWAGEDGESKGRKELRNGIEDRGIDGRE